jgi:hypothetical protein
MEPGLTVVPHHVSKRGQRHDNIERGIRGDQINVAGRKSLSEKLQAREEMHADIGDAIFFYASRDEFEERLGHERRDVEKASIGKQGVVPPGLEIR